jgi:hypothetical protein
VVARIPRVTSSLDMCPILNLREGTHNGAAYLLLVGLSSKPRSISEASQDKVKIPPEFKWFHVRQEVRDRREAPRRGASGDENARQVSICRHTAAARHSGGRTSRISCCVDWKRRQRVAKPPVSAMARHNFPVRSEGIGATASHGADPLLHDR